MRLSTHTYLRLQRCHLHGLRLSLLFFTLLDYNELGRGIHMYMDRRGPGVGGDIQHEEDIHVMGYARPQGTGSGLGRDIRETSAKKRTFARMATCDALVRGRDLPSTRPMMCVW